MNESLINRFIYNVIVFDDDDGNGWDVDADGRWEKRLFVRLCINRHGEDDGDACVVAGIGVVAEQWWRRCW